jgi:two-component system, chemotaxis family, protein-glutamate methylesterase/glutaminase
VSHSQSIRVLVVDDSEIFRRLLVATLSTPEFVVVGEAADGGEAAKKCAELKPDVVSLDLNMGRVDGFSAIREIMAFTPTPILVLSGLSTDQTAFRALEYGALDIMGKPDGAYESLEAFGRELRGRLHLLAGVKVITHVRGKRAHRVIAKAPERTPVVGIGASLGGPRALAAVLRGIPKAFPAPICIVQHISVGFTTGLATWLASECALSVREAKHGDVIEPGYVYIAPSGAHLTIGSNERVVLDHGTAIEGFKPSVTALFSSMAKTYGPRAVGVILTGMGRDGAQGLLELRSAGGRTLAQDESTSVVYGMPRAAAEFGAVERALPLEEIAPMLVSVVREVGSKVGEGAS